MNNNYHKLLRFSLIIALMIFSFSISFASIQKPYFLKHFIITASYNLSDKLRADYTYNRNNFNSKMAKNLEFGFFYKVLSNTKIRYNIGLHYGISTTHIQYNVYSNTSGESLEDGFSKDNDELYWKLSNEFFKNIYTSNNHSINLGLGLNIKYSPSYYTAYRSTVIYSNNQVETFLYNTIDYNIPDKLIKTVTLLLENEFQIKNQKFSISNTIDYSFDDRIDYSITFNPNTIERHTYSSYVNNRLTFGIRLNYHL